MGMTIDKAIDRLEDLHFEQDDWECGELTEDCLLNREALRLAIDIMCKYQKIQHLYSDVLEYNDGTHFLEDVSEVIEDGNND